MLRSLRSSEEPSRAAMLQSYHEGFGEHHHLGYGGGQHLPMAPHYHQQQWYNSYVHQQQQHQHEGDNGSSDYLSRGGDGKATPDWRAYREMAGEADPAAYIPPQTPQDGGYPSEEVGPMMSQLELESPLMGQVLQDPLILPTEQHQPPLVPNGVDRLEPQPHKEEEESLPKVEVPKATPGTGSKKDTLKLPGFHQTFGNITEIGRFSQPDEFFETRPPEIPDPPPKVSESLEVKRKPRGRKRKQPEPRELYPRSEGGGGGGGGGACSVEPQWPPPHHWEPPAHHWHRPHPYHPYHQYHHSQYQQSHYYPQPPHLDCPPPPPPPYHYYQPNPWHPAAREYVHHHPYQGFV